MSIPGVNLEDATAQAETVDPTAQAGADPAHDDQDDVIVGTPVNGQQMAPVSEVIKYRRQAKELSRKMAEMQPQLEQAKAIGQQLQDLQPVLQTLQHLTPEQRQALAQGKLPSPAGTAHNERDGEAIQWAEMNGFIAADGSLDVQRARQNLDWLDERHSRQTQAQIAPLRQTTAQQAATGLKSQAKSMKDSAGTPLATGESIEEAYSMLPPELASQPNVAIVAIGTAMLIDKMKGRRPQAEQPDIYGSPLYSEPSGRRGTAPAIAQEDLEMARKAGLSDKTFTEISNKLAQAGPGRRGFALE